MWSRAATHPRAYPLLIVVVAYLALGVHDLRGPWRQVAHRWVERQAARRGVQSVSIGSRHVRGVALSEPLTTCVGGRAGA